MAGRRELGFPKTNVSSLKEQLAKTTLRNVRMQGHTYVELREEGKRFIFFCTLCLAPCYSDSVLFDHLKGNIHNRRLAAAKATLLKPNPWPFNDGVLFFQRLSEEDKELVNSTASRIRLLANHNGDENELAIVCHGENISSYRNSCVSHNGPGFGEIDSAGALEDFDGSRFDSVGVDVDCTVSSPDWNTNNIDCDNSSHGTSMNGHWSSYNLVVPDVLHGDEISNLEASFIGVGQIAARCYLKDEARSGICRIWCEWLGMIENMDPPTVPELDFAVVTFAYDCNLGRKVLLDDVKYLLSSRAGVEIESGEDGRKKRRKSFSDPEDISESLTNHDSSGDDAHSADSISSRMLLDGYDDQLLFSRSITSKAMRRELRRQQRVIAERMCAICQQRILPGKDAAALLNRKTGRLVCSSRNRNGAFHVFHISCLIHWILLCELEIYNEQLVSPKVKRRSRRKIGAKCNGSRKEGDVKALGKKINSVLCPECQGSGINIDGDELEKPTIPLSEMFRYKIKASDARRAWMKSPEELKNCSTGFYFPSQSDEPVQENVSPLKLLCFYRADKYS